MLTWAVKPFPFARRSVSDIIRGDPIGCPRELSCLGIHNHTQLKRSSLRENIITLRRVASA
jgi:hypothetical protein